MKARHDGSDGSDGSAVAEAHEIAAIEFEPLVNAELIADLTEPKWSAMVVDLGVYLRLAAITVGKTKPELVDLARDLLGKSEVDLFDLIGNFGRVGKHLHALADIVDAAFNRMNVAVSVIAVESESESGAGFSPD